jgi:hypothetical protein
MGKSPDKVRGKGPGKSMSGSTTRQDKKDKQAIELVVARLQKLPRQPDITFVEPGGGELTNEVTSLTKLLKTLELLPVHEPPPSLTARTLDRVKRMGSAPPNPGEDFSQSQPA